DRPHGPLLAVHGLQERDVPSGLKAQPALVDRGRDLVGGETSLVSESGGLDHGCPPACRALDRPCEGRPTLPMLAAVPLSLSTRSAGWCARRRTKGALV